MVESCVARGVAYHDPGVSRYLFGVNARMSRTATHGHHNLITSGHGDKLSRSSEAVARDGRLSRLLASRQRSIGDGIRARRVIGQFYFEFLRTGTGTGICEP